MSYQDYQQKTALLYTTSEDLMHNGHLARVYEAPAFSCRQRAQIRCSSPLPAACQTLLEADNCYDWTGLDGAPRGIYI